MNAYDKHPLSTENWNEGTRPKDFNTKLLPVYIASNVYYNNAEPYVKESNSLKSNTKVDYTITKEGNTYYLNINLDDTINKVKLKDSTQF